MKWNDYKGMERNRMYLRKRNKWNGMELSNCRGKVSRSNNRP